MKDPSIIERWKEARKTQPFLENITDENLIQHNLLRYNFNQLKGTKAIVIEMSGTIRELKTQNDNFQAEIARLREEIQLLEMQIKK